jgi:hypothetical protein
MSGMSSATGFRKPQGVTESRMHALSTKLDRIARRMSPLMPGSLTGPRRHEVDDPEQPRVLEAGHHAGTRRVEVDLLCHMALVYVQRINGRGSVQCPAARYRHHLIVTTPSRARRRANAATGDAHQWPEAKDSFEADFTVREAMDVSRRCNRGCSHE